MNELQIFISLEFGNIRIVETEGQIWFCGKDSAIALGYKDTPKAIKAHCREDWWAFYPVIDDMGRTQQIRFINEPNLYRLITHSKLPSAENLNGGFLKKCFRRSAEQGVMKCRKQSSISLRDHLQLMITWKRQRQQQGATIGVWLSSQTNIKRQGLTFNLFFQPNGNNRKKMILWDY